MVNHWVPVAVLAAATSLVSGCSPPSSETATEAGRQSATKAQPAEPVATLAAPASRRFELSLTSAESDGLGSDASRDVAEAWRIDREHELTVASRLDPDIDIDLEQRMEEVKAGTPTTRFPTVGMLLIANDDTPSPIGVCSGTLVGFGTFVTAAHCIGSHAYNSYWVYLQHAGVFAVDSVTTFCEEQPPEAEACTTPAGRAANDLAVVQLVVPPPGSAGAAILSAIGASPVAPAGSWQLTDPGTIVGFGKSSQSLTDHAIKRWGTVEIQACQNSTTPPGMICFTYSGNQNASCPGDSGGPMFRSVGGVRRIIGVSSTTDLQCASGEGRYVDITDGVRSAWIQSKIAPFVMVGTALATADDSQQMLGTPGDIQHVYTFSVPEGIRRLVVTMNHPLQQLTEMGGSDTIDFTLDVPGADGCDNTLRELGVCIADNPMPGSWTGSIKADSGSGLYQFTLLALVDDGSG